MVRVVNLNKVKGLSLEKGLVYVNGKLRIDCEYIGRGSSFGNRFKIGVDGSRSEVVKLYWKWFYDELKLKGELWNLMRRLVVLEEDLKLRGRELNLVCFCAPLRCHGDVLKKWIEFVVTKRAEARERGAQKPEVATKKVRKTRSKKEAVAV